MVPPSLAQAQAGPSGQNIKQKSKKGPKNFVNSSKVKKLSEKQKIEELERDAASFVSNIHQRSWSGVDTNSLVNRSPQMT
jgi:hypothetical protein